MINYEWKNWIEWLDVKTGRAVQDIDVAFGFDHTFNLDD